VELVHVWTDVFNEEEEIEIGVRTRDEYVSAVLRIAKVCQNPRDTNLASTVTRVAYVGTAIRDFSHC
jgi:hypothetical protein